MDEMPNSGCGQPVRWRVVLARKSRSGPCCARKSGGPVSHRLVRQSGRLCFAVSRPRYLLLAHSLPGFGAPCAVPVVIGLSGQKLNCLVEPGLEADRLGRGIGWITGLGGIAA